MKPKSLGLAIILTLFFGPLGLFYASVTGGLIMCLIPVLLLFGLALGIVAESGFLLASSLILIYVFAVSYWIVCVVWAATAVSNHNYKVLDNERQVELLKLMSEIRQGESSTQNQISKAQSVFNNTKPNPDKPCLQEWSKKNPHLTINDYYRIYGGS
jgi:hypothetical protein